MHNSGRQAAACLSHLPAATNKATKTINTLSQDTSPTEHKPPCLPLVIVTFSLTPSSTARYWFPCSTVIAPVSFDPAETHCADSQTCASSWHHSTAAATCMSASDDASLLSVTAITRATSHPFPYGSTPIHSLVRTATRTGRPTQTSLCLPKPGNGLTHRKSRKKPFSRTAALLLGLLGTTSRQCPTSSPSMENTQKWEISCRLRQTTPCARRHYRNRLYRRLGYHLHKDTLQSSASWDPVHLHSHIHTKLRRLFPTRCSLAENSRGPILRWRLLSPSNSKWIPLSLRCCCGRWSDVDGFGAAPSVHVMME